MKVLCCHMGIDSRRSLDRVPPDPQTRVPPDPGPFRASWSSNRPAPLPVERGNKATTQMQIMGN
ncbi:hypothetical protein EYF80_055204 [Liparis tanakae]|uniref:Uncharacterized protein n=1 Tax=Liparis tanakae TaxID=230148 RepID=A0A4Z2F0S7_9TELE|nr:hypothetical protein EYF80_055204 [Liparis tanakae]